MPDIKTTFTLAWKYEQRAMRQFERDMERIERKAKSVGAVGGGTGGGAEPSSDAQQKAAALERKNEAIVASKRRRGFGAAGAGMQVGGRSAQMLASSMGGAGGAAGFVGETAGGVAGAVGGGLGQGAGVLAAGGTFGGAAAAAAVAIPVAMVAVGAAAAAKLAASSLSLLKTLEPGRRDIFRATGVVGAPAGAEAAAAGEGLRPSAGLAMGGAIGRATGRVDRATMNQAMQLQQAFGIGPGAQAGMLGAFARRGAGGSQAEQLRMTIAAGMSQALTDGRLHELFPVMESMASGRAPGMRPMDPTKLASFLANATGSLRGQGGQFAAQNIQDFMTKTGIGQAVGMTAAGLGRGTDFFDAFQTMQAGPFSTGGVSAKQFVNQFSRMAMGKDFNKLGAQQQKTLGFMFGQQQGIPMESAMGILKMGAGGDEEGFQEAMKDVTKSIEQKTFEVLDKGFNRFESVATQWERMLTTLGEALAPRILAMIPIIIERMHEWAMMLPKMGKTEEALLKGAGGMVVPDTGTLFRGLGGLGGGIPGMIGGEMFDKWLSGKGGNARDNADARNSVDSSAYGVSKTPR